MAREGLLTRGGELTEAWADALHALADLPHVIDSRTIGLVAGIELAARPQAPGARAHEVFVDCFERGLLIRVTGEIIALSPPLIVEPSHIDQIVGILAEAIKRVS